MDLSLPMDDYRNIVSSVTEAASPGDFGAAKIVAWVVFGAIGFVAFSYGAKSRSLRPALVGVALMGYPYFVSGTWPLYIIGAALTVALYFWRE
jgi:hypothetical protein